MSHPNPAVGMLKRDFPAPRQKPRVFRKHTLIDGRALSIRCIEINGQIYYSLPRQLVSIARLEEEWFEDVADPGFIISALANSQGKPDIFTLWQRLRDDTASIFTFSFSGRPDRRILSGRAHWFRYVSKRRQLRNLGPIHFKIEASRQSNQQSLNGQDS